jgi:hypothetical protein
LQYFVVQKAMIIFNGYLKREPERLVIPQTMLREVLQPQDAVAGDGSAAGPQTFAGPAVNVAGAPPPVKAKAAPTVEPAEEVAEPKPADVMAEVVEQEKAG